MWKDAPFPRSIAPPSPRSRDSARDARGDTSFRRSDAFTRGRPPSPERPNSMASDGSSKDSFSRNPHRSSWDAPSGWTSLAEPMSSSHPWGDPHSSAPGWSNSSPSAHGRPRPRPSTTSSDFSRTNVRRQETRSPTNARRASPPPVPKEPSPRQPPPPQPSTLPPRPPPPPAAHISERKHSLPVPEIAASTVPDTSRKTRPSFPAISKSEKRKAYKNRITKLSEAVLLQNEYTKIVNTLEARRRMVNSQQYSHVSETSQSKLNSFVQESEEKAREVKTKLDDIFSKLVESEDWPEESLSLSSPDFQDIQSRLKVLEDKLKNDMPSKAEEPRIDVRVDTSLLSRLEELESRLDEFSNETLQLSENMSQNLEARIEEKLEALRVSNPASSDVEMRDGDGSVPTRSQEQIAQLKKDFDGFADEIVEIIQQSTELKLQVQALLKENATLKARYNNLESIQEKHMREATRLDNQVQALIAAVKIINNTTPPTNTLEQMRSRIRDEVREEILSDLNPVLLDLRKQCEAAVVSGRDEILKHVVTKLGPTMEVVDAVHGYIEASRR